MLRQQFGSMLAVAAVVLALWTTVGCGQAPTQQGAPAPRVVAVGDGVVWIAFPPQKQLADPTWGAFLSDIENHLPACYGSAYRNHDRVTWCHETTHGINAHIRNTFGGAGRNAFYVGYSRAALVEEPRITIGQVAKAIPPALRGSRYDLYLVKQRAEWDRQPLYLWDEWVAYTNGAKTAIELAATHPAGGASALPSSAAAPNREDLLVSMLEFNIYSLYLVKVAQENRTDSKQLVEFFGWNWRRALLLYEKGKDYRHLNWDNGAYLRRMLQHPEVQSFLVRNGVASANR